MQRSDRSLRSATLPAAGRAGSLSASDDRMGLPVRKLSRTGSSMGASDQICEWQFMQVFVGGIPANGDVSTEV